MKPQHLAITCESLAPHNLAGRWALALSAALADRGNQVSLLCGSSADAVLDKRVELVSQGGRTLRLTPNLIRFVRWQANTRATLNPDRVISLTTLVPGDVLIPLTGTAAGYRKCLRSLDAPLSVRIRAKAQSLSPVSLLRTSFEKRTLTNPMMSTCMAVSPAIEQELSELINPQATALHRLDLGPPDASPITAPHAALMRKHFARAWGLSIDSAWLVFPFTSAWIDGFEPLMLAFKSLIDRGFDADLLLAGPYRYTHLAWIAQLGLRNRVRFIGQPDDPGQLLPACDLMINPTAYDPAGGSATGALACGLPIVTTSANGLADRIKQQGGTILDSPAAPDQLAQAITKALNPRIEPDQRPVPNTPQTESPAADLADAVLASL